MHTQTPSIISLFLLALLGGCAAGPMQQDASTPYQGKADIPVTGKPFAGDPENFQFVIVGDRTGGHRHGVFRHAMTRINQLQPEFVIGVGDLIEGYKEDEQALSREWDEFDSIVDALDMPFFYTVGNHDISNAVMRDMWQQRYGRDYYHFIYHDVLFISLNTEDPPVLLPPEIIERQTWLENAMREDPERVRSLLREHAEKPGSKPPKLPGEVSISDAQVDWVASVLAENAEVRWTVVLMHKPAWVYEHPGFSRIEALLADRPHTVIAGHEHYYNYSRRGSADYITMATTGGIWLNEGGGAFDHIAWVTMTDNGPVISNIALCGLLGTPSETGKVMTEETGMECFRPGAGR